MTELTSNIDYPRQTLDAVFKPKSIAVIGATPKRGTIGHQLLQNIFQFGFSGIVFPVNPKYESIHSIKCYPSVSSIPDPVDLAFIVIPKESVAQVAEECGEKGVGGLVILSAGFKEVGGDGLKREEELSELQRKYGFRIIGPNCMGILNTAPSVRLNGTFAPTEPESGSLAFMTQSGALGVAILLAVKKRNLGVSYFVSVGNRVDVSGDDLLEYWAADERSNVIGLYLESFGDPRRFTNLSKEITRHKPIIVVKSGRTAAGSRAASSHTGQLAGLDIAVDALLHQCGVIRVSTLEEMMDLVLALTKNPVPKGDRVCILTNAGGPAIMATDAVVNEGLTMAKLTGATRKKLAGFLPEESSLRNPVDMIASAGPDEYGKAMEVILEDKGVDTVIVIFVPPMLVEPREVMKQVAEASSHHKKPVYCVLMAEDHYYDEIPRQFKNAPPLYRFPESAVRAISAVNGYRIWCERPEGNITTFPCEDPAIENIINDQRQSGGGYLSPVDVNRVLRAYGFPLCNVELVPTDGDVVVAAEKIGYPLVLKVHGEDIIHKSDVGGVIVDIPDERQLLGAKAQMDRSLADAGVTDRVEGFLVQEVAKSGKEVILGMTMDETFGPLLMFGMGGKYVEVLKDIAFRVMPVTDVDAIEMIKGIRSYPLLEGVRGEERVDIDFIVESIQRLAQMVNDIPAIVELDMNPVIVTADRGACRVVDSRIRVAPLRPSAGQT
ncbi:MAG: acetate--CoA ligase family protein [Candidatus Latescibacterota bacterium]|nr:MAG: acetate--CoA ligase family protein [Candidatus Latescibacterota bacterium]